MTKQALLCRCSNSECNHECDIEQLDDLMAGEGLKYLSGGDIVPDGWCPECGHSAYEINDFHDQLRDSRDELLALLERVDSCWNSETGARLERLIGTTTCNLIRTAISNAKGS